MLDGTVFAPCFDMVTRTTESQTARTAAQTEPPTPLGRWYLVVDDDRMMGRATLRWIQRISGQCVRFARTVHQAQCWFNSMPRPTGIVTDFELQGEVDGVEALLSFREQGVQAPAIVLTGAPTLAQARLGSTTLVGTVPVLDKGTFHTELEAWLLEHERLVKLAS